jgi:thiol-disulfide isomerase/thioredoxin
MGSGLNFLIMKFPRSLILSILIFLSVGINAQVANITDPRLQINLTTPNGDSLALASLKGKVILLDFWASWCPPCRYGNRQLVKIYKKYNPDGFEIFGVSLDESIQDWKKAIEKDKISWTQVIDPRGQFAKSAIDWNVYALPTSYLINKNGDVVGIGLEGKELEKALEKLLKE